MPEFSRTRRNAGIVLLVALFFVLGIYIGFNNRPEIDKVLGISK